MQLRVNSISNKAYQPASKVNVSTPAAQSSQNNREFKLPSYDLSFGMAKIVHSNSNCECTFPRQDLKEIYSCYDKYNKEENPDSDEMTGILDFFNKYTKTRDANLISLILKGNNKQITFDDMSNFYLRVFLTCLFDNFKERPYGSCSYLDKVISQDGLAGKNIAIRLAQDVDEDSKAGLEILCEKGCELCPQALCKILTQRDDEGKTALDYLALDPFRNEHEMELINDAIYNLATQNENIEVVDAVILLEANEMALDPSNRRILDMFHEGDFVLASDNENQ